MNYFGAWLCGIAAYAMRETFRGTSLLALWRPHGVATAARSRPLFALQIRGRCCIWGTPAIPLEYAGGFGMMHN